MPKIDIAKAETRVGASYPAPFDEPCRTRTRQRLGAQAGLTHFGVNLLRLPPGGWSSQRHWHTEEDEFVWVVEGEVVLVDDDGETVMRAGDCAGFKAGVANGHHLQNRSGRDAVVLEAGSDRRADLCTYPDIDLLATERGATHRDGTPY